MTQDETNKLGKTLWAIADRLRGSMDADDFRDYMLAFLFLRYLSDNYEAAAERELGGDYPKLMADDRRTPLAVWYADNEEDIPAFEKQMRSKVHYVILPKYLWTAITETGAGAERRPSEDAAEGFQIHRGRVVREHLPRAVLGDQSDAGETGQDLHRTQRATGQDRR